MKSVNNNQNTSLRYGIIAILVFAAIVAFPSFAQGAGQAFLQVTPTVEETGTPGVTGTPQTSPTPTAAGRDYTQYDEEEQGREECGSEWIIMSGESLSLVVINCDVPLDTLLEANPDIEDPNLVVPGQVINIPEGDFAEILNPNTGLPYVLPPQVQETPGIPGTGQQPTATPATGQVTATPEDTPEQQATATPQATPAAGQATATPEDTPEATPTAEQVTPTPEATPPAGQVTPTPEATPPAGQVTPTPQATPGGEIPATGPEAAVIERGNRFFLPRQELTTRLRERRIYSRFDDERQGRDACDDRWIVHSGETLSLIVINCDVPLDNLLQANPQIQNPDLIFPGEIINIPDVQFREIVDPRTGLPYVLPFGITEDFESVDQGDDDSNNDGGGEDQNPGNQSGYPV